LYLLIFFVSVLWVTSLDERICFSGSPPLCLHVGLFSYVITVSGGGLDSSESVRDWLSGSTAGERIHSERRTTQRLLGRIRSWFCIESIAFSSLQYCWYISC